MKGIWKLLDMGRNTMSQDRAVHWVGQQEISLTTTQPRGCSEAAMLGKLLYPLQHNAQGHKRSWIWDIVCHLRLN
jgi:hypothetical protein